MILNDVIAPVEKNNVSNEHVFKIKTSSKAFEILSKSIYSDPIAAPIRELSANAWDSHKRAKNPEQFIVHLPNEMNSTFYVRDFGTGMSEEDIHNIYTTYFESTKSNSNDEIGCLGLGSKTPFCCTDIFVVTSFFNGIKKIFSAFLENGLPKIAKMHEEPTDEKNGLMVAFSVKSSDFSNFYQKAKSIFSNFNEKPKIIGHEITFEDCNPVHIGHGWITYDKQSYYSGTASALMGNILYPIKSDQIGLTRSDSELIQSIKLVLKFDIGEIEMSASREHLQYTSKTILAINEKLQFFKKDYIEIFEKEILAQPDFYSAKMVYFKYENILNKLKSSFVANKSGWIFDGKDLKDDIVHQSGNPYEVTYFPPNSKKSKKSKKAKFYVNQYIVCYIGDAKNSIGRIKQDFNNCGACLFNPIDDAQLIKNIQDYYGSSLVFRKTSDLTDTPKLKQAPRERNIKSLYVFNRMSDSCSRNSYYDSKNRIRDWHLEDVDVTSSDPIIYFNIRNYDFVDFSEHDSLCIRKSISVFLNKIDPTRTIKIYGLNKKLTNMSSTFINFSDFILKYKKEIQELYSELEIFKFFDEYNNKIIKDLSKNYKSIKNKNSIAHKNFRKIAALEKYVKICKKKNVKDNSHKFDMINVHTFEYLFNKDAKMPLKKIIGDYKMELFTKYPMLGLINEALVQNTQEILIDYINFIDKV